MWQIVPYVEATCLRLQMPAFIHVQCILAGFDDCITRGSISIYMQGVRIVSGVEMR